MAEGPPTRDFIGPYSGCGLHSSPGARKEKARLRAFERPPVPAKHARPYAELRAASAFSFLNGSSLPEDLVERGAALDLPAMALVDTNGVSGAPRFWKAAKAAGVKALVGAEIVLQRHPALAGNRSRNISLKGKEGEGRSGASTSSPFPENLSGPLGLVPPPLPAGISPPRLTLLVENQRGYKNLCLLLTAAAAGKPKGQAAATWEEVAEHAEGLHVLTGGEEGGVERAPGPRDERCALRRAEGQGPLRRAHVHPPPHAPRRGRHEAARGARAPPEVRGRHGGSLRGSAGRPRKERRARGAPFLHARGPRLPLPRVPAAAGRDAVVLPQAHHVGRRAGALPAAHGQGAGADPAGARPHREAGPRGLLPHRLGHRELLQARAHPRAGARLGGGQGRVLRAFDHGGGSRQDGASLRALPLGGAWGVARHRPRLVLGRPAREGDPARLQDVRRRRRRDDGERHHVPLPFGRARDSEGPGLLAGAGGHDREAPREVELRRVPRRRGRPREGDGGLRFRPRAPARRALREALHARPEPAAPPRTTPGRDGRGDRAAVGRPDA